MTEEFAPGLPALVRPPRGGAVPAVDRAGPRPRPARPLLHPDGGPRLRAGSATGARSRSTATPRARRAEIGKVSAHDAKGYLAFHESPRAGSAGVLEPLLTMTPPVDRRPVARRAVGAARRRPQVPGAPARDAFRLLRWGPMAVADLVAEFFETELLRAVVAARGIYGTFAGPVVGGDEPRRPDRRRPRATATPPDPRPSCAAGMGALTQALAAAAKGFGAEVRTGAAVARDRDEGRRRHRRRPASGEEVAGPRRRLERRPEADAPRPAGPGATSIPTSSRGSGTTARSARSRRLTCALTACPNSRRAKQRRLGGALRPHPHRPRHRLPRARLRRRQVRRLLAASVLRRHDPDA